MQLPRKIWTSKEVLMKRWRPNECRSPPLSFFFFSFFFTWASLEKRPWILMRDDTVTTSLRAPCKDSSSSPPQSQQSGGLWGRLCLISISKPLHCQLSQAAFPPVCAQVNVWNVWGWHHPPWESVLDTHGERKKATQRSAWFLHRVFSISLIALPQKSSTLCLP